MVRLSRTRLLAAAALCGLLIAAVDPPVGSAADLPANADSVQAKTAQRFQPSVRSWVTSDARKLGQTADESVVRAAVYKRFLGQTINNADVDALVMWAMMEASRDTDRDLRAELDDMRKNRQARQDLRDRQSDARAALNPPPVAGQVTATPRGAGQPGNAMVMGNLRIANARLTDAEIARLKGEVDALGALSEEEQLRLQRAMDRRAKFIQTLSNLLKKISETQGATTSNLK